MIVARGSSGVVSEQGRSWPGRIHVLLLDRDGLLIENVPYLSDPHLVRPIAGVGEALDSARAAGLRLGVVTNQSGIGRGLVDEGAVERVNQVVERALGPFDVWMVCPHAPEHRCGCRKPAPGLLRRAAGELGVEPSGCAMVGDRATDLQAAARAGCLGILVPSADTTAQERRDAAVVVGKLGDAVEFVTSPEMAG